MVILFFPIWFRESSIEIDNFIFLVCSVFLLLFFYFWVSYDF